MSKKLSQGEVVTCLAQGIGIGVCFGVLRERQKRRNKQDADIAQIKRDIAKLREGAAE